MKNIWAIVDKDGNIAKSLDGIPYLFTTKKKARKQNAFLGGKPVKVDLIIKVKDK